MSATMIGTVTLTRPMRVTQYSEHAAWTDYVQCEPQTVELRWTGYWLLASFAGALAATTYPKGSRTVGEPASASMQWSYAGFDQERLAECGFSIDLTRGRVEDVGVYSEGTSRPGSPIRFYRAASHG